MPCNTCQPGVDEVRNFNAGIKVSPTDAQAVGTDVGHHFGVTDDPLAPSSVKPHTTYGKACSDEHNRSKDLDVDEDMEMKIFAPTII